MRFFSGNRNTTKKKHSASEMFKKNLKAPKDGPEKTQTEKYKEMMDARVAQLQEDAMMGKKGGFQLPGTKQSDAPKEMSANAKKMMVMLAQQKMNKEQKIAQKKQKQWEQAKKKAHKVQEAQKTAAKDYAAAQYAAANKPTDDGGGGGWGW